VRNRRALLGATGASLLAVGVWAQVFPRSFYDDFPMGRSWVSLDGPYNEHLVRDVGGLNLGLALATVAVAALGTAMLLRLGAVAVLLYSAPHLAYHATHLDPYGSADRISLIVTLALVVVVPVVVALLPLTDAPRTTPGSAG
jgi:hypothetical protein